MAQPTTKQGRSIFGDFTAVLDATDTVSEKNVRSLFGDFTAVIDATAAAPPPAGGTPRVFATIY
jgi:hypothetical protein